METHKVLTSNMISYDNELENIIVAYRKNRLLQNKF